MIKRKNPTRNNDAKYWSRTRVKFWRENAREKSANRQNGQTPASFLAKTIVKICIVYVGKYIETKTINLERGILLPLVTLSSERWR